MLIVSPKKSSELEDDVLADSPSRVQESCKQYAKDLGISEACVYLTTAVEDDECIKYGVLPPSAIKLKIVELCARFELCSTQAIQAVANYFA